MIGKPWSSAAASRSSTGTHPPGWSVRPSSSGECRRYFARYLLTRISRLSMIVISLVGGLIRETPQATQPSSAPSNGVPGIHRGPEDPLQRPEDVFVVGRALGPDLDMKLGRALEAEPALVVLHPPARPGIALPQTAIRHSTVRPVSRSS